MKALVSAILLCASAMALSAEHYIIYQQGKQMGVATISIKMLPNGGKYTQETITIVSQNQTVSTEEDSWVDSLGRAYKYYERSGRSGGPYLTVVAHISNGVAHATSTLGPRSKSMSVVAPKGAVFTDPAKFWFVRTHPKRGTTAAHWEFNVITGKWIKVSVQYVKDALGGHELRQAGANGVTSSVIDSKGYPIVIELPGGTVIKRR